MDNRKSDNSCFSDLSSESKCLLSVWQKIYFKKQEDDSGSNVSQSMRGFIQQIYLANRLQIIPPTAFDGLLNSYDRQYADVVDSSDKNKGLNNYSAEALSLAKLKATEIDKWRSSLNLETLPSNLLAKKKIKPSEAEADAFLTSLCNNWKLKKLDNFNFKPVNNVEQTSKSTPFVHQSMQSVDLTKNIQKSGIKRKCISPDSSDNEQKRQDATSFRTAKEQLIVNNAKTGVKSGVDTVASNCYGSAKKSLGPRRGNVTGRFVPPLLSKEKEDNANGSGRNNNQLVTEEDDRLKNIDAKMIELITNEIMDNGPPVTWDDIAGLEFAKKTIKEIVVLPILRPDIFTGLRGPPKGLLLFGPPGTGKTLIGKCIASQSKSTFFSISASSLTSKWIGDGEKMVRALFAVARCHQPAVIFIDEIDSLLTQRSDSEHESSRRMKTEILIQLDGATTSNEDRILVVGATNRPQELDEAARRRLVKRLYIPLPELEARKQIIISLLKCQAHNLTDENITDIGNRTAGYSGADMANLCKEAALGPIRCLSFEDIEKISPESVRPILYPDFLEAIKYVKSSVSEADLVSYLDWNQKFGSNSMNTS